MLSSHVISKAFGNVVTLTNVDLITGILFTRKDIYSTFSRSMFLMSNAIPDGVSTSKSHLNPPTSKMMLQTLCGSVEGQTQVEMWLLTWGVRCFKTSPYPDLTVSALLG